MSITKIRPKEALDYHENKPAGKIEVNSTKSVSSQHDLALAYSPGVAEPCKVIADDPGSCLQIHSKREPRWGYFQRNSCAGIWETSDRKLLSRLWREKEFYFKKFAGIDVFDIEIDEQDPDKFIEIVKSLEPTFGGINLEDIKAPESFKIEQTLRENK